MGLEQRSIEPEAESSAGEGKQDNARPQPAAEAEQVRRALEPKTKEEKKAMEAREAEILKRVGPRPEPKMMSAGERAELDNANEQRKSAERGQIELYIENWRVQLSSVRDRYEQIAAGLNQVIAAAKRKFPELESLQNAELLKSLENTNQEIEESFEVAGQSLDTCKKQSVENLEKSKFIDDDRWLANYQFFRFEEGLERRESWLRFDTEIMQEILSHMDKTVEEILPRPKNVRLMTGLPEEDMGLNPEHVKAKLNQFLEGGFFSAGLNNLRSMLGLYARFAARPVCHVVGGPLHPALRAYLDQASNKDVNNPSERGPEQNPASPETEEKAA